MLSNIPATKVLANYSPAIKGIRWTSMNGGFSGAGVWRGDDETHQPVFALKAWQPEISAQRLATIHAWMNRAAHLAFVPSVVRTSAGETAFCDEDRCWDMTGWMPGVALANPTLAEVEAACVAVARLHQAWPVERVGVCPGVLNRLCVISDFRTRLGIAPPFHLPVPDGLISLVRHAWNVVAERINRAEQLLRQWEAVSLPLAPCVRDLREEHVLFSRGEVVGIVDYGAMAIDQPAVDLARLLGGYEGYDEARVAAGVRAYRSVKNGRDFSEELVRLLAETGSVCSLVGWLIRLVVERRKPLDEVATTHRMQHLLLQVQQFAPK